MQPGQRPRSIHIGFGVDEEGRGREVFLRGGSVVGSDRDAELDDIGVIMSRLMQFGQPLDELSRALGRLPSGEPASIFGAVVDSLLAIETTEMIDRIPADPAGDPAHVSVPSVSDDV